MPCRRNRVSPTAACSVVYRGWRTSLFPSNHLVCAPVPVWFGDDAARHTVRPCPVKDCHDTRRALDVERANGNHIASRMDELRYIPALQPFPSALVVGIKRATTGIPAID